MNLPKGPATLCFDKDEFMKVRAGRRSPEPGRGQPALLCPPGPLLGGDLTALRSESLGLRFGRCRLEEALL